MNLADKIRKARETSIEVGGFKLKIRRPTDIESTSMAYSNIREAVPDVARYVIGWEGVKESDLIDGGKPDPVQFDSDLFGEWISDRPDLWEPIINGVLEAYRAHRKRMEAQGNA